MLSLLAVAQFMLIVDVTVVAIALPDMQADLGVGRSTVTWVVSGYALTFGGLLLVGGRAADLWGGRRVALSGLVIFTAASLLTGLAAGPVMLVGGRVAQGVGAALLSPAALSLVVTTFTGEERNRALGIWSALGGAGAAAGVLVGGVLTAGPGWPWVFFVNVPVGAAIWVGLYRMLPVTRPSAGGARVDVAGAVLAAAAAAATVYGLTAAGEAGMGARSVVPIGVAVVLYGLLAARLRSAASPLVDPGLLTRRPVVAGTLLIFVATGLMISVFFLGTFYLQHFRGHDALTTGLLFLPVAAATVAGAQAAGKTVGGVGTRRVAVVGLVVAAVGALLPVAWGGTAALVAGASVIAAGAGALFVAASSTTLSQVDHAEAGIASGVLSTFHEFGAAFGVAATSSLAAVSISGDTDHGFTTAFLGAAIVAMGSAVLSRLIVPARSAPTQ
jgi:MFS family permease